ncbi:5' nucleotidase, NT5C type [Ulvibacter litoralis]|uniref:5'(3')-deoxyribonucleotidase n=1 Tax=Ulvibacter litoralis TaxID=227084 RepID=A0A1G7FGR1_9FLAO|nr:5'(3')-deoxyribonucleotidase [Ulvibacter litoralis]GHC51227.1 putative 5'(3')-deoxyribonucleotidase [Ulvibacter litoralis]SDE75058.1 5'(3')-deoxyribonucleotidase [Ulvibacter litoralis]
MTIFVDMDDVLADTYSKHIELYNKEHKKELSLAQITSGEVWQNVPEIHKGSIMEHANQPGFFRDLKPIKDSQTVMEALYAKHEVYIATAATQFPNSLKEKSDWLDQYFPFITWQHRIMCGHKFILKGDLLIDDRTYNLDKFDGDTLLFTSPHNALDNGYTRVSTWLKIAERLL